LASDLRGHGQTSLPAHPDAHPGWPIYAQDLVALLDVLKLGPMVLAGHSMGATSALLAAAIRPDLVKALVLFDPVAFVAPPDFDRSRSPLVLATMKRRNVFPDLETARQAYTGRGAFKTWPAETLDAYLRGGLEADGEGLRLSCEPRWEAANFRLGPSGVEEAIGRITCPLTVMMAEEASTTGPEARAQFRACHPDARIEVVPGTSHFLPMERPELVRELLREALNRP
jgi:pimeloyl-ACP methyl ester carboxylesterase